MINKKIALILSLALSAHNMFGITQVQPIELAMPEAVVNSITVSLAHVQESSIQAHKTTLKNDLFYKKITRIGTKSLAAMALIYVLYGYISPWLYKDNKPAVIPGVIPADTGAQLEGLWKIVDPGMFSWQWFKNNGKSIANSLVAGTVASAGAVVAGDVQKAVFHPDSLEWYVQNKTNLGDLLPFQIDARALMNGFPPMELQMHMTLLKNHDRLKKSTIEELREYINALECAELASEKEMTINLIQSTCNSMVASLENILGFMALKQDSASEATSQEIESHIRYVINSTNLFCDKLALILMDQTLDSQKKKQNSISALSSLKGELHRICMRFVSIEREQGI